MILYPTNTLYEFRSQQLFYIHSELSWKIVVFLLYYFGKFLISYVVLWHLILLLLQESKFTIFLVKFNNRDGNTKKESFQLLKINNLPTGDRLDYNSVSVSCLTFFCLSLFVFHQYTHLQKKEITCWVWNSIWVTERGHYTIIYGCLKCFFLFLRVRCFPPSTQPSIDITTLSLFLFLPLSLMLSPDQSLGNGTKGESPRLQCLTGTAQLFKAGLM